jgi:transcriptional regulator with XRE-family HTH domain
MGEVARVYPLNRQQPEPLWREVLGGRLRALRAEREETLAETAERAGISPQYLSEVERGRKEPSSEMIAALAGALDTTLADLTTQVTEDLRRSRSARSDRGARAPRASSVPGAPGTPGAPSTPGAPGAPVLLALAA